MNITCPKCNAKHLEHHCGVVFVEGLELTMKCHCGANLDIIFKKVPNGFFGVVLRNFKLEPTIITRGE